MIATKSPLNLTSCSFHLQAALSQLVTDRETKLIVVGPSRQSYAIADVSESSEHPRNACKRYSAEQIAIDYSGRQLDEATAWQEVSASAGGPENRNRARRK